MLDCKKVFEDYFKKVNTGVWAYRNEIQEFEERKKQLEVVKKYSDLIEKEIVVTKFDWS